MIPVECPVEQKGSKGLNPHQCFWIQCWHLSLHSISTLNALLMCAKCCCSKICLFKRQMFLHTVTDTHHTAELWYLLTSALVCLIIWYLIRSFRPSVYICFLFPCRGQIHSCWPSSTMQMKSWTRWPLSWTVWTAGRTLRGVPCWSTSSAPARLITEWSHSTELSPVWTVLSSVCFPFWDVECLSMSLFFSPSFFLQWQVAKVWGS